MVTLCLPPMTLDWLLCSYRLPREPSRLRLAVWRRLRRAGAVMLHDGLWALPAEAKTREALDWLAEEIEERGGTVLLWEGRSLASGQDGELVRRFRVAADERYAAIAEAARKIARGAVRRRPGSALQKAIAELRSLERGLRLERRKDYFRAPGRLEAELAVREAIDTIKRRTDAVDHPAQVPRRSERMRVADPAVRGR
jgi:hypothetical protein